jgi:hypothetical protein
MRIEREKQIRYHKYVVQGKEVFLCQMKLSNFFVS